MSKMLESNPLRRTFSSLILSLVLFGGAAVLNSCGDTHADSHHQEMVGGHESGTTGGLGDMRGRGASYNTNGMGTPVAGGHQNVTPDTLGYHDSARTRMPF